MAIRKNPDGSITVGILEDEKPIEEKATVEKPKTKRSKAKSNGEG
jgi:hypothetical protein